MTPAQWILVINLALELWEKLDKDVCNSDHNVNLISNFLDKILPKMESGKAGELQKIIGGENENVPSLLNIIDKIGNLFD